MDIFDTPPPIEKDSFLGDEIIPKDLRPHLGSTVSFCTTSIKTVIQEMVSDIPEDFVNLDKRIKIVKRLCGEEYSPITISQKVILLRFEPIEDPSELAIIRANNSQAMIKKIVSVYKRYHGIEDLITSQDYQDLKEAYDI